MYIIECHNEFCWGPERWGMSDEKPGEPLICPACGWLAKPGSGIKYIEQIEQDEFSDI